MFDPDSINLSILSILSLLGYQDVGTDRSNLSFLLGATFDHEHCGQIGFIILLVSNVQHSNRMQSPIVRTLSTESIRLWIHVIQLSGNGLQLISSSRNIGTGTWISTNQSETISWTNGKRHINTKCGSKWPNDTILEKPIHSFRSKHKNKHQINDRCLMAQVTNK